MGLLTNLQGDENYPIDRLQHSLQAATRALRDGRDDEYVVCALLHDIGESLGPFNHGEVVAAVLKSFVSEANRWMLEHHPVFQVYFYGQHLGIDPNERERYRESPYFDRTGEFCALYDEVSFDGGTVKFVFKGAVDPQGVRGPVQGQIRSGTAIQVGVAPARDGSGRGSLKISGVFAFDGPINLAAPGAKANILAGLNESDDELVLDGRLTLAADERNTANTARFKTARGETPAAEVTIGRRGRGQFTFLLDMSRATIDVPAACPRPDLATVIEVDDGTNPPLLIAFAQPWQCLKRGGNGEYLRTP